MRQHITVESSLVVVRDDPRDIRIRNLELWIDGTWTADLRFGESWRGALAPGPHAVRVTNRLKSKELVVDGPATLRAANVVGPVGGAMMAIFGIGPYGVELERLS